jgi:hypothetical protein
MCSCCGANPSVVDLPPGMPYNLPPVIGGGQQLPGPRGIIHQVPPPGMVMVMMPAHVAHQIQMGQLGAYGYESIFTIIVFLSLSSLPLMSCLLH